MTKAGSSLVAAHCLLLTLALLSVPAGLGAGDSGGPADVKVVLPPILVDLPFSEGSGTSSKDVSGNAHHARFCNWEGCGFNGPKWDYGRDGCGVSFNVGGSMDRLDLPGTESIALTSFSVEIWVFPRRELQSDIAFVERLSNTDTSFILAGDSGPDYFSRSNLFFTVMKGGKTASARANLSAPEGEWTHLLGTYDGTEAMLYVDGAANGSDPWTPLLPRSGYITIAGPDANHLTSRFVGIVDGFRLYDGAVSAQEAKNRFDAGNAATSYCKSTSVVADIQSGGKASKEPFTVDFIGAAQAGWPPYAFNWDFGDGERAEGQNVSHHYGQIGEYNATLTVTDSKGGQAKATVKIGVYPKDAPKPGQPPPVTLSPLLGLPIGAAAAIVIVLLALGWAGWRPRVPRRNSPSPPDDAQGGGP
jgi:hypothetical protein